MICSFIVCGFACCGLFAQPVTRPTTRAASTHAAKAATTWPTYIDEKHHFSFNYPPTWKVNDQRVSVMHYTDVLAAVNSAGKSGFTVRDLQTSPNEWEYSNAQIAKQLPAGAAYVEVNWFEFLQDRYGKNAPEMEADNISELLKSSREEDSGGEITTRGISFFRWGRNWHVVVYQHEPVAADVKADVAKVLSSFRFNGVPAGDEVWAVGEARKKLPAEADPDRYTREGGSSVYWSQTKVDGSDVIVTFTKHVDDAPAKSWSYRVAADGDVRQLPAKTNATSSASTPDK